MGCRETLKSIINDLNNTHSKLLKNEMPDWESGLPSFTTAENGSLCHFDKSSLLLIRKFTSTIYANDREISSSIQESDLGNITRKCIADFYTTDSFSELDTNGSETVGELKKYIKNEVERVSKGGYTHYFPAWVLFDENTPLSIGPVKISGREVWIDSINSSQKMEEKVGADWKDTLKELLNGEAPKSETHPFVKSLFIALESCPFLIEITLANYEKNLSSKLAESICKTALDSLSLLGGPDLFHQQTLHTERQLPTFTSSLTGSNGNLWVPGRATTARISRVNVERIINNLNSNAVMLNAFENILKALAEPSQHKHPELANRWATALDWLAEGARERNDAIAVAKMATCLDVLSCVGRNRGIREMLENLFDITGETEIIKGDSPVTLSNLVKNIYDKGRSQILHGSNIDKLQSLTELRNYSFQIAELALYESAIRLGCYTGEDGNEAFRTMPDQSPEKQV